MEEKPNILLVDDRKDGLITLEAVLSPSNYNLITASSGEEALAHVLHRDFAVIILDVQMPGMDGFETAALIKQRERSKHIPILFVTAINKDSTYVTRGYEMGAIDYIFKPFDPQILRSKVNIFVEVFKKNQQLATQAELLRRSEERYRLLIESANDIIATLSMDGAILSLNPAFDSLTGWEGRHWQGRLIDGLLHPADAIRLRSSWEQLIAGRRGLFESKVSRRNGEYFNVEFSAKPLRLGDDAAGLLLVGRDISERLRAEQERRQRYELERSNRELEQFAYICSHDLQEPLRIVTNFAQLLNRTYRGRLDERADEMIGYITGGTERMSRLIKDLLEFSRVGHPGVTMEMIDLEEIVREAKGNLSVALSESNATLTHDKMPRIFGNYSQMVQLFQNLISNAIKFRHKDRPLRIHFGCQGEDDSWNFQVEDNGIGFRMEYSERIFEIFKRLHSRDAYPGTGVGLSICKRIIERHSGHIWATGNPDKGAVFHFTLPNTQPGESELAVC